MALDQLSASSKPPAFEGKVIIGQFGSGPEEWWGTTRKQDVYITLGKKADMTIEQAEAKYKRTAV